MSAAVETITRPEPTVASSAGEVEASPAFVAAHSTDAETHPAMRNGEGANGAAVAPATTSEKMVGKDTAKVTATPVSSGLLGYKAPGLINSFRFKKHFFYLGDAAVPAEHLGNYLRGEKPEVAHPTVAWSSQTGKGLLYIAESETSKAKPIGIISLAEATAVTKAGENEFQFKVGKDKHTFQAKDADERNGWIVAVEKDREVALSSKEAITGSAGYKESHSGLSKPAAVAGATAAAGAGAGVVAASESKKSSEAIPRSTEKDKKSRSQSRGGKRNSMFGGLLGKKEEELKETKAEQSAKDAESKKATKEETVAAKEADKHEKEQEKSEAKAEKEEAKVEKAKEDVSKAETKAAEHHDEASAAQEKKLDKKVVAGAAGATAATAATGAAVLDERVNKKSDEADKLKENESPKTDKTTKRRSMFGGLFGGDKSKNPSYEKKSEVKTADVFKDDPIAAADHKETKVEAIKPETVEAFKGDPTSVEESKTTTAPVVAAAAAPAAVVPAPATTSTANGEPAKTDKTSKRSSVFGLGSTKKRPSETGEATSGSETEKKSSKFGELFRRPSKAAKDTPKKEEKAVVAPTTVPEVAEKAGTEAVKAEPAVVAAEPVAPVAKTEAIGDVVPDAVTIGQSQTTAAPVSTAA